MPAILFNSLHLMCLLILKNILFNIWDNWGHEISSNWPKYTHSVTGRITVRTQKICFQNFLLKITTLTLDILGNGNLQWG